MDMIIKFLKGLINIKKSFSGTCFDKNIQIIIVNIKIVNEKINIEIRIEINFVKHNEYLKIRISKRLRERTKLLFSYKKLLLIIDIYNENYSRSGFVVITP